MDHEIGCACEPAARGIHSCCVTAYGLLALANARGHCCANALGEIRCAIGRVRGFVDQGAPPQFVERQRRVYPTRVVEVAI